MSGKQSRRLPSGGRIDRNRPVRFRFEGRDYQGFEGDTLASALLASSPRVLGRSFKYHRPRGLLAAGVEESNVLVKLGTGANAAVNLRATEVLLREGLVAEPVNCWPSAGFDLGAVNSLFDRFLPAGFYYKTLMWPSWHLYEWAIRRAAGLGKPSREPDPDVYDTVYAHCDVLVVGGGPAGLAAAHAAALSGARVILAEQDFALGGRLLWDDAPVNGVAGSAWVRDVARDLALQPETRVLLRTTALGYFDHNEIVLVERDPEGVARARMWQVRARRVILATGALERPLVFPGNDRPGVMLSTAVRHYLNRFAVLAGRQAVIVTNNDDAYSTALALGDAGASVSCLADTRPTLPSDLSAKLQARGIRTMAGAQILGVDGAAGVRAVRLRSGAGDEMIACDLVAMSGGLNPAVHLFTQSGGALSYDDAHACIVPGKSVQAEVSLGACAGDFSLAQSLKLAHAAGVAAAAESGFENGGAAAAPQAPPDRPWTITAHWGPGPGKGKAFVDFQNDVTTSDVALAARENLVSVEHLKRYTTQGMAIDQGKTSNVNALALMAGFTGRTIAQTGTTRNRFPYTPVEVGAFNGAARGQCMRPFRNLAAHDWHVAQGAVFEDFGGWMRPAFYARGNETQHDAEQREARIVREHVGLFDGSPLGKIEVRGPDAAKLLDRIYANTMSTLKPGKLRYGLMLNEQGVVIDDGVAARFSDTHFLVGTTGAGASRIAGWIDEWLQCEWPDLDVVVAPVTTAMAVLTISGPKARDVLLAAGTDIALSTADFPHMTFRDGSVAGIPARIFRVSFTGEMSYEINVATHEATQLVERLMAAGKSFGIAPVGVDAWMLLRTEKGYMHVGADTDGTTVPDDVGWGHVSRKAVDFIGKRSLALQNNMRSDRLQLVGLETLAGEPLKVGAHIARSGVRSGSEGHVTSSGFSPVLRRPVALAMISGGRARTGETVDIHDGRRVVKARIASNCAYDPEGVRLNA